MKIYENKLLVSSLKKQAAGCLGEDGPSAARARISHPAAAGGVVESS
jgi:hypothetical protein